MTKLYSVFRKWHRYVFFWRWMILISLSHGLPFSWWKMGVELCVEERNLLSVAYKNVIGARRASWRIITTFEEKEALRNMDNCLTLVKKYRKKVEEELTEICWDVLKVLDKHLIKPSCLNESQVFYNKMCVSSIVLY